VEITTLLEEQIVKNAGKQREMLEVVEVLHVVEVPHVVEEVWEVVEEVPGRIDLLRVEVWEDFKAKKTALENVHRFLIPEDLVRVIIGKGGVKIKAVTAEIQEFYPEGKVSIYSQKGDGSALDPNACDRVMSIQANSEGLVAALNKIIPDLQYETNGDKKQKLEVKYLAPAHTTSAVIGKGGDVIKRIKGETKSFIQVYTLSLPHSNETVVRMQNFELEDLVKTVVQVVEQVAPNKSKQPISFYDPIAFWQGEHGDTGSYVDAVWFQQEIKAGRAGLTPFGKQQNTGYPGGAYGGGAYGAQQGGYVAQQGGYAAQEGGYGPGYGAPDYSQNYGY